MAIHKIDADLIRERWTELSHPDHREEFVFNHLSPENYEQWPPDIYATLGVEPLIEGDDSLHAVPTDIYMMSGTAALYTIRLMRT